MRKQRILLVDDSSSLTTTFRLVLERTGRFIVEEENSGEMAVDTAHRFQPDLIFLDDDLGSMHGREVLAGLQADADLMSVPVAFITASLGKEDAKNDGLEGLQALAKPVWPDELIEFAVAMLKNSGPALQTWRARVDALTDGELTVAR